MLLKTEKRVKIRGKTQFVIREQYLRDDIRCHSPLCFQCPVGNSGPNEYFLDVEATHYAIPCYDVIAKYLEIFELPEIRGIIIVQSISSKVQQQIGRRQYDRYISIGRDSRHGCAVFLNEICKHTNIQRTASQTAENWLTESTRRVGEYYYEHLKESMPIIYISEDPDVIEVMKPSGKCEALDLRTYLQTYWSNIGSAVDLYDSIKASLSLENTQDSSKQYSSHLPLDILEGGIKSGRLCKGVLRVNKHRPSEEAFVALSRVYIKNCGDILISGMKNRNRSIHGDEVVVEILPKNEWKSKCQSLVSDFEASKKDDLGDFEASPSSQAMPTGKVVGVLERRWRDYVASLPEEEESNSARRMGNERVLVIPYDYRIPRIRMPTKQSDILRNQRVIVRIDNWDKDSQYPNGHFVKALGDISDPETELLSLLVEHGVSTVGFPQSLLADLPKSSKEEPWQVDETEVSKRLDLRETHLVFSIDPKGCEDVDDALSVRYLSNGNVELGVHIADVTYFVQPHSLTDIEARIRSTSVYLPNRRYDMLPHVLSGDICSLLGSVDRYAVSVIWELDSDCEVQSVWYGRTVVRSRYKMFYEAAQRVLMGQSAGEMQRDIPELQNLHGFELQNRFAELKDAIVKLADISSILRARRLYSGGLELSNVSYKFEIDKDSHTLVTGIRPQQELQIHRTVAECMIFANEWVAKKISTVYPQQALLRHHPSPKESNLKELQKLALSKGFSMNINSNKELADSLEKAKDPQDPLVQQVLRILATHAMNQASYFSTGCFSPSDFYHYGLGLETYTHFTSPIRRYADVLVHRFILSAVADQDSSPMLKSMELEDVCDYMNMKHKAAQDVEKAAQELFQTFFFNNFPSQNSIATSCLADGIIYSLRTNGVLIYVPLYGIKGAVYLSNKSKKVAIVKDDVVWVDGHLQVSESCLQVKAADCIQKYSMFDHITVCIRTQKTRAHQPRLVLDLVRNCPYAYDVNAVCNEEPNVCVRKTVVYSHCSDQKKSIEIQDSNAALKPKNSINFYQLLLDLKAMSLVPQS